MMLTLTLAQRKEERVVVARQIPLRQRHRGTVVVDIDFAIVVVVVVIAVIVVIVVVAIEPGQGLRPLRPKSRLRD